MHFPKRLRLNDIVSLAKNGAPSPFLSILAIPKNKREQCSQAYGLFFSGIAAMLQETREEPFDDILLRFINPSEILSMSAKSFLQLGHPEIAAAIWELNSHWLFQASELFPVQDLPPVGDVPSTAEDLSPSSGVSEFEHEPMTCTRELRASGETLTDGSLSIEDMTTANRVLDRELDSLSDDLTAFERRWKRAIERLDAATARRNRHLLQMMVDLADETSRHSLDLASDAWFKSLQGTQSDGEFWPIAARGILAAQAADEWGAAREIFQLSLERHQSLGNHQRAAEDIIRMAASSWHISLSMLTGVLALTLEKASRLINDSGVWSASDSQELSMIAHDVRRQLK